VRGRATVLLLLQRRWAESQRLLASRLTSLARPPPRHDEAAGGAAPGCFVVLHPFVSCCSGRSFLITQEAGERNTTRATPSDEPAADQKARRPVLTAALIGIIVIPFVQIVLGLAPLLQQLDQERATYAPPAQDAAGDQEAQELALAIGAFLANVLVALIRLIIELLFPLATPRALSEETRYQCATDAAAPKHPAAEDQAQELALVVASRLLAFLVVIILIRLIFTLGPLGALFDEMREEDSAHTPAPQQAAAEERAHELAVVIIPTLFVVRVLVSIFLRPFRPLAEESCDECAADPAVSNHLPADCEFREVFSFPCIGAHVVLLGCA